MFITIGLLAIALSLFYGFYRQRKEKMSIFKKMGIPGPEPNFLFGNLLEFKTTPLYKKQQEWRKEFGETYGYFEGPSAILVTSDVDLLNEVYVKQFNNFHARKLWPVQVDPDKDEDVHMFFARGRRWKRLRNVVNPAFSSAKLKKLTPLMNESINHLMDVLKEKSSCTDDRVVEVMELFRRLTLDSILRCEIGIDQNSVKNPDDPFLHHCKGVIEDTTKLSWLYMLGYIFPSLHFIWIRIYKFLHNLKFNPVYWLEARMREVIVLRRNLKETERVDLVQHMLNAQFPCDSFQELEEGPNGKPSTSREVRRQMTNEEIVQHAFLFLLAGYETTSTSLAYIFYELSRHPQVQQRLRHEVKSVLPRGHNFLNFEDLKKLTYLDYVIWEALRKYPLASIVIARQCMKSCRIGNLDIPSGMLVHANVWDVQYDSRHWGENPEAFNPLRFMPEKRRQRHPMAWMPFGTGPRACAGMKFAFVSLKMVVAKILRDFDFNPDKYRVYPLPLKQGATVLPADGVRLATIRRESAKAGMEIRRSSIVEASSEEDFSENELQYDATSLNDIALNEGLDMLRRSSVTKGAHLLPVPCLEHLNNIYNKSRSRGNSLYEETSSDETTSSSSPPRNLEQPAPRSLEQLRRESLGRSIDLFLSTCQAIRSEKEKYEDLRDDQEEDEERMEPWKFPPTMDDVLAHEPRLRKSQLVRRGSIQPELESVRESTELDLLLTRKEPGSTTEKLGLRCQYLAKRRGSG